MPALVSKCDSRGTFAQHSPRPLQAGADEIGSTDLGNQAGRKGPSLWDLEHGMQRNKQAPRKTQRLISFLCYLGHSYLNPASLKVHVVLQVV